MRGVDPRSQATCPAYGERMLVTADIRVWHVLAVFFNCATADGLSEPWCEHHCAQGSNKQVRCMQGAYLWIDEGQQVHVFRHSGLGRLQARRRWVTRNRPAGRNTASLREQDLHDTHSCQTRTSEAHKPMPLSQWDTLTKAAYPPCMPGCVCVEAPALPSDVRVAWLTCEPTAEYP